jgi:hypothetical protein
LSPLARRRRHRLKVFRPITALVLAITFSSSLNASDEVPSAFDGRLRKLIQTAAAAGRKASVTIDILKRSTRATVVAADDENVKVEAFGTTMDLRWKDFDLAQTAVIATEFAQSADEHMLLLEYYVSEKDVERAEKIGLKIVELDSKRKDDVAALLQQAPQVQRAAPVIPKMAEAPKPGVNHAGRALPPMPPMPPIKAPVMFNTPECDAILRATQVFPKNNAWNEDISQRPVHPDSDKIVKNIGADTAIHIDVSENFIIVPPDQPKVDVKITMYAKLADPGPFPMPASPPIQGWGMGKIDLEETLRVGEGDRHILLLDPINMKLHEFYHCHKTPAGMQAAIAVTFDLNSNKIRPKGWTSADASGMAMFPGIIKYHELEQGLVEHAIRLTVSKTRKEAIYPATHHYAGHTTDPHFPAMGQRFRLKASVDISKLPKQAMAIALALKKYGAIVADNGRDWDMCATPDKRIDYEQMRALHRLIKGSDLEVIVTTGENEGPRTQQ